MSTAVFIKMLMAGAVSLAFVWVMISRHDAEADTGGGPEGRQRYLPYISGMVLPLYLLTLMGLTLVSDGGAAVGQLALSAYFGIFLHIGVYYALLLALLPLLRRRFSARACAVLWMIPNYLYFTEQAQQIELPAPLLVVRAPGDLAWILLGVWAVGAAAVLVWKIVSHLVFRRRILRCAVPVADPAVLSVWQEELERAQFRKPRFRLVTSPDAATPLSVGLFPRKIRVVLPERAYSREELALLFRHELIHIGREDAWSKFFLVFCTAMCWFNPLMWIAMRKSADDLELSCDETVLMGCGESIRRQYAQLLLRTAGDERGFTTCLSASASALRYRLKNVMKPVRKWSGALLVGLTFFALSMSCGYVAMAYGGSTGGEAIYRCRDASEYHLREIYLADDPYDTLWLCPDEEALYDCLASLELCRLTGSYAYEDGRRFTLLYDTPEGLQVVALQDETAEIVPLYDGGRSERYYIPGGMDWAELDEVIIAGPALNLSFREPISGGDHRIGATLCQLTGTRGSTSVSLLSEFPQEVNGAFGYDVQAVTLDFSRPLVSGFRVDVQPESGGTGYSLFQWELDDPYVLPLADFPARYTVSAMLKGEQGGIYDAVFQFDFGDVD